MIIHSEQSCNACVAKVDYGVTHIMAKMHPEMTTYYCKLSQAETIIVVTVLEVISLWETINE